MPVQYNSKKLIPAPFVKFQKNYDRSAARNKIGSRFTLTVTGTVLPCKGSPNSAGEFWSLSGYPDADFQNDYEELTGETKHKALLAKMQALRNLFAEDGKSFEIQPVDGSAPMKCYPTVVDISFDDPEGGWYVDRVNYSITLECDEMFGLDTEFSKGAEDFESDQDFFKDAEGNKLFLADVSESWSLEMSDGEPESETEPFTFRLTHTLNAVGKKAYNEDGVVSEGWEQAKRWVTPRLGIDNAFVNGTDAIQLSGKQAFNHVRQENTDKFSGAYSVTETWLLSTTSAREDFTISIQTSAENAINSVRVEGEVVGLEERDPTTFALSVSKWTNALARYTSITSGATPTVFTRAQSYSGLSLNSSPLSTSVGKNPITGRINYSYEYDTRPSNCITGAVYERLTISDQNPADVFASIAVMGRAAGPVLQDMETVTERRRTVSIEVGVTPPTNCFLTAEGVAAIMAASPESQVNTAILAFETDLNNNYNQVFKENDNPTWEPKNGRYSRSVTWVFQNCP